MEQTGTRCHFPDRNRIAGHAKSNIVVVRGTLGAIENVRQRIRVSHWHMSAKSIQIILSRLLR